MIAAPASEAHAELGENMGKGDKVGCRAGNDTPKTLPPCRAAPVGSWGRWGETLARAAACCSLISRALQSGL